MVNTIRTFGILIFLLIINSISCEIFNYDFLKLFEIDNTKTKNFIDGEYYKLHGKHSSKNLTLDFGESIEDDEEIFIETIYRINFGSYEYYFSPFNVRRGGYNGATARLRFFGREQNQTVYIEANEADKLSEVLFKFNTTLQSLSDSKWHMLQISFSKRLARVWLDCNLILNETAPTNNAIFELFEGSKEQLYTLMFSPFDLNRQTSSVDIKKYNIAKQKIRQDVTYHIEDEQFCLDLKSLNINVSSPLDLTTHFGQKFVKSNESEIFYQFQKPIKRNVRVPFKFTKRDEINNFCFEIVFRHVGTIQGQMCLFKLKNYGIEDTQSISINSGKIITYIWDNTFSFQHARAKLQNINVYDGKWHRLQVEFILKKDKDYFGDTYSKTLKFYLDCDLFGEDNLPGYIPFMTTEQSGTFFENNLASSFTEFDVMSMEMKENYEKLTCEKVII